MEDDLQEAETWASSKTRSPTPHPRPHPQPRATSTYERPASREDFDIAFICALPIEKTAVQAMFDDDWDDVEGAKKYGTARPDTNAYSHGRIGSYNVVVANIGGMGKRHAAAAATHICHTWPKLQLILVVGICGAVPFPPSEIGEIILGDVVISSGVIQYDFGRRLDSGFVPKKEPQDLLPGPRSKVRPLLDKLRGVIDNRRLRDRLVRNLGRLEADADLKASYLGAKHDVLFRGNVRHVQEGMSCREAGCQGRVHRKRLVDYDGPRPSPAVHIGLVGSADTVMKSGSERDRIAMEDGVIAFEMEGAGVWGDTPCLVIKGVCDYADGHKMKKWQSHAAAAAAAGAAAFLDDW
ncbi:nucleoside phosphorylase domain-containing protein [Plectosphaerella plurivora]|uniref:Nucleoside phosphorylase domain-containing protein n=1 Tax=Plectosphaerella plurivora TaxID=936078 RepID=A0A9P8VB80_9PEZI|nr:nucleoside phosphorylase domain-containing protein [Plectosphaerella plurivora]